MVCIYCHSKTDILNSRSQKRSNTKWRRRVCTNCQATLTSIESYDLSKAVSVRTNSLQEPFSRDKLFISVYNACKHLKRPEETAAGLTDTIISKLLPFISEACITRDQIVGVTAKTLKLFNMPAYVQYTAFHPLKPTAELV